MPFNSARVLNTNDGEYYPMSTFESGLSDTEEKSVYRTQQPSFVEITCSIDSVSYIYDNIVG
jgi:hypothetical protein